MRWLTAIPIYNEARHIRSVLDRLRPHAPDVLAVDDGSTDGSPEILAGIADIRVVSHPHNRGYGAAIASAFRYAVEHRFDALVTIDCDGQHDPTHIPTLIETLEEGVDIVSGSRYLGEFDQDTAAPGDRRQVNRDITRDVNTRYGFRLTDAFCGFKAYRRSALERLRATEPGWGMPLQVWVQAFRYGLSVREIAVPRIYTGEERHFGGGLDDSEERLAYYRRVISAAEQEILPKTVQVCECDPPTVGGCREGMRLCRCGRLIPSWAERPA